MPETDLVTRAKFKVAQVVEHRNTANDDFDADFVTLMAVTTDDANKLWAKYTPYGKLEMSIQNPALLGCLAEGEEVYLDLRRAQTDGVRAEFRPRRPK